MQKLLPLLFFANFVIMQKHRNKIRQKGSANTLLILLFKSISNNAINTVLQHYQAYHIGNEPNTETVFKSITFSSQVVCC